MSVKFEWDPKKANVNFSKHGVSFEEAMTVFSDPLARIFNDDLHSTEEQREIIIGHTSRQRLLLVSFIVRETTIRILSAREATAPELRDYEENAEF
jgi:uncharacterized DUF497 family protein